MKYFLALMVSPFVRLGLKIGRYFGRDKLYHNKKFIDPYLNYSKKWWIKKVNINFADKFLLKQQDFREDLSIPKTFFTFDKNGNILTGEIPTNGKIVIKYNKSDTISGTTIVDAKDISKKWLKKFYHQKLSKNKIIYLLSFHTKFYKKFPPVFYGEEFIENVDIEFKIYSDLEKCFISLEVNNYNSFTSGAGFKGIWFNNKMETCWHPTLLTYDMVDIDVFVLEKARELAFYVRKKAGFFGRVDLLYSTINHKFYLSEYTANPSGFFYDRFNKNNKLISDNEKNDFINFMTRGMKK